MRLTVILTIAALSTACCAQTHPKAEVFSGQAMTSQLAGLVQAAKASGGGGATLGDYQSHAIKLSVRTASGGAESTRITTTSFSLPRERRSWSLAVA